MLAISKRWANAICKPVTPGGEGACMLQFLNAGTTLEIIFQHDNKKTYAPLIKVRILRINSKRAHFVFMNKAVFQLRLSSDAE